jgi:nitrous oxidase accessory protein
MREMKKELLTAIIISALLISIVAGVQIVEVAKAEPRTIVVPTDYPTIKEAISNAVDGDTIYVKKGTYQESNIVVDKSILVEGEDKESTIVTSQSSQFIMMVNHSQVTITGLTLIAGNTQKPSVDVSIYTKTLVAVQIEKSQDCTISSNKIINSGTAIWLHSSSNNIIESNTLWDNYYGVDITGLSTNNFIRKNDISSSQVGVRFSDRNVNNTIVCANNITSAYTGLFYYFTSLNFVVGNHIAYNIDATHFVSSYSNVLHHNNFVYNTRDISEFSSYYDNVRVAYSINLWDDKKEGNFWSDYKGTANNGIGTTPYILNDFNRDNYPLLEVVDIRSYASYSSTELPYPNPTQPPSESPNPSSTTSLSPSPSSSPTPTPSPSPSPTPSLTPYSSPSGSPTQQPTLEPTQSAKPTIVPNNGIDPTLPLILGIVAVVIVAIVGLAVYFTKRRKMKTAN